MDNLPFMGVYAISGICDHRALIGSTNDLERRFSKEHLPQLKRGTHYNRDIQQAWDAFGPQNFIFLVLERVSDERDLQPREKARIVEQKARGAAYNRTSAAPTGMRGRRHTLATRAKMSEAKTGEKHPRFGKGKVFRIQSPSGEIIEAKGLRAFCIEHQLNPGNISSVLSGRLEHSRGWRRVE